MAKKWEEVASNPEYQNLSSSEKEDVRKEYFENVVKPNVPSEDLAKAQKDFDQFSNPSAARKAINAIKSGVTLFKDAAYDAIDNRTLSEKGLLTSKESDENAMSRKVPGVPLRVDYFDKLKQQDRIAPKSIDAMAGTKGATARAADTVIAERPFNADVNQGTNDAIYGEPQKQIPFDERKREERRLEAEAKAKLFTESLKQAGETRSADQALQQAVNKKPSQEEVTNVANQIAHKEEMQAMYGDIPKPEGMDVATNAAGRAVKTGSALAQNMIAFGSSVVNADDLALKFLQSAAKTQDEAGQYPAALKDFTEIQSWSDVPTYALEGVIENAPMLVGSIGSGALGAFTAKNLGKNKLAKLTQEAAVKELAKRATIGATVGAGTASIGMESGSIFGDIYRETGEQRTALAAAGGIVAGAFDAIPAVMALKTALGGKVGEEAAKTIIKRYGVDGLKQIGAEGGTEFAQTWVEEIAKARASGNDVLSQQNLINSLDAMFKGGAAGGVTHIAAQGFNDLTAKKVEKFKTLPNENLQRLRATAEKAMPQDVPLIDAEIQRRANTPTLQRAVEAGMREGGITQPAETLPASDILENENDGISDATSILATETDGLGLDNTEGSRGDIPETTGSGTVSDWIIDSTRPLEQGDGGDLSVRGNDSEGKPDVTLNDVTAHAAATSDLNDTPQPTEAQKEAGNYKKGSVKISGMDISVENPHTSTRSGVDKDGTAWENQQNGHYGYIKGVVARSPDKEHVDVNVKPNTAEDYAGDVFVINQNHPGTGKFDEPKVYIGYGSKDEAEAAYRSNYADGWNGLDSVAQIPMEQFKEMLNDEKAFLKPVELKKQENEVLTPIETIDVFKEKGRAVSNKIDLAQNKDGKWVAGYSFQDDKNSYNGGGRAAQLSDIGFDTKEEAISDVAAKIAEFIKTPSLKSAWQKHIKQLEGKENGLQKQGQKTAQKINKQTPKVNSLLSKIFNLGGITSNDKLDVTGQDKSFAPGGYNKIFKKQSRQSLRGLIENGDLDEFLPHNMRVSSITQDSDAYDSAEAYDYLADKIRAGEKVLPYEAQQEIEQNKYQEDLTAEEHVDLVASTLTEDKIIEEFRISILATDFIPDNEDGVIESSQREAIGKQTEPQTVTSQEREGVRPIVEAIAKRRAAANQINKAKAFDANLQLAKDFMAGKDVKPVKFTTAATLFNKDSALNESFNKLATMAKAPAKEARAEKSNTIEAYKQRIAEAKTADALQTIAGEIQRDSALSDAQAQALDDIVFDAQDKFETSEPEAESLTVQTRRKELENAQGIWAKEPSSLVKIALVRQAEKKLNEAIEISNDVNAETTNDSDINKQSSKEVDDKQAIPAADLLNDNTAAKQAIADAERAKDAKRNEGIADTEGFALTGSNSEADKATAMGAQDLFAQPKDETPTNQDEVNYNGVRLYKIKVRNRIEGQPPTEMWAVESLENKARKERGERALGGDTLSESLEEAKSEADLMLKRDAENKQAQALQNEYDNAQQEQARTEAEKKSDIDGFGAELNAMQLGKLKETLNKPTSIKGEVLPLRDTVRKLVAQGGKPEIKEENVYKGMSRAQYNRADNRTQQEDEKRIRDGGKKNVYYITMPDGGMYDLGKTAHDFAEHLISKKNSDVEEEKPQLELTGNELTKKSGALKDTSDVGIEMLGNRRNKGLTLNDIQNADNDTERVAMAVKNKLWEKPDYQALVDSGIQPIFAHIVKQVYDSLSTKPAYKGEKMLYDYVNTVEATKKAVDELLTNNNAMAEMTIAVAVKARQQSWMMSNSITELGEISKEIKANENALNFLVDRVFPKNEKGARWGRQNTEGNDKANATGNRFYKNISLDLSSFVDAIKAVEQGFPAKQEAWERSYQIKEKDGKFQVIKKGRFTPKSEHATHEEAVNAARELVKRQREEQFKEPETPVEKSVRKGREIRTQGNVSSQELKETIGLKAVNFGDWMKQPSNAKERQEHVNSAFDAFHDLAEVINVPVKAMSLDGMLGLAIGAQGKGKFAAHFYPGYNEINLTREKGAGSLAHEWAHGLDHYFGVKAGLATRDNPFASWIGRYSNLPESNIRKEVADAFNAIVKTMRDTTETVDAAKARIEATAKASKDRLNSYIERNGLKDAVKDDAKAQSALDAIIAGERGEYIEWPALKGKRKPQGFTSEHVKVLADKLGWNFDRAYDLNLTLAGYSSAQEALKTEPTLRNIHTEYYREASRLDAGKKDSYWTTSHELFARAFEMYVADKIANADGRNDYLVAAWKQAEEIKTGNAFADEILNEAKKRYPQGNERKAINDAFDVLFKEIQTKESDDGNVVMFSRSKSTQQIYENRIDDLFADGKADFKGTGVKVLDKSDMLNLLGYGDKPVYLSENKVQQGKYNHGLTAEHWKKIPEWLDDPALVFDSDTVTGRLVFIAPELLNGAPIRIIVDPDATANGLKINLVVNAYDAKGKLPFGRWVKDGLLRFYSKAKSLAILARSGLQLSSMAKARSSNGRIYQDSDLVNYKNEDKTNFSRSDAKLPAMREKIMGGLPLFAQGNKKVGMPIADVEKEVKNFSKGWKRIPQVIVVDSMQDERINEHVRNTNKQMIENGATGLPIGFISQGKVYILAPMVNNKSDIATVMMHEIFGHAGLRANFGTKLDDILEQIYITRRKEVLAKAKQYGYDFTKHADRLKAAEEVLAEMAQTNPQLGFVKRAIAAIRAWLRANIPYYKNLEITDEDIIGNILIPARNFILKGKTGGSDLGLKKVTPVFSRTNQIKSATGNNGDFDSNNNDIRFSRQGNITPEWDAPEASKIDSLIYTLQDKHIDLKRVTENIKNVGNHIDDRWNAYLQEELYHGRAAKRTQDFIKHELEPLIKDMQERKVTMADFEEYLWMRHAPERNKKMASINEGSPDGLAGVSTKDAKEYLANLTDQQKLDFEALAERIDAINKASEQVLIDYGLESTDTIAKWNSTYKHYVPLMREDMENGSGNGTGQGFSVKGNASKRATGSKRAVVDILANIAQQREKYIIRGEKNRVSTALIGLAKLNPNDEFWKTDTPPTITAVSKATGMVETYTDPNYKNRDNVIVARIPDKLGKIQERSVIFNEFDDRAMRMARSLKNLDQDQLHEVLGTASIITRYFSSINTQYNPIFGVINLLRDTQTAAINLSSTPLKGKQKEVMSHVLPALIGIYSDLRSERESGTMPTNEYAILFEEFQKEGGQTGYRDMYRNAKERSAAIENALDHEWWTKTKIGKAISANGKFAAAEVWMNDKAVKPIFNWLSDYNEAMENAVRLSAYKVAIDNGLSKQQAASIAKNISVNFNRKGEMGRQIGSLYAFFNASVQGTARIADTLLKNDDGKYSLSKTGKTIVKGGLLLGVMQALLLAAAGYSDDDPPAYSKDRNLIIPLDIFGADNKYATIALPLGFNAIPAFSRHITEWALSGGEDTHDRVIQIIDMILNVTNPIGNAGLSLQTALPTLADPLAAIAENKDFTGRDISRKDFNQLDPTPGFTRSRDKAWDVSIAVARAMNWASGGTDYQPGWASPTADQIEYLAGQVTGGVGREIIKAGTTVDALISGEDLPSYKIPLLGRFYGDAASQSSQGAKFYKNITELNKIENELKGRAKNHEDVNSFKENNPEYRAIVTARISLEQVQNLRKRQRAMVEKGEDKEKIKDIDEKITMIMTRLNTKVEDYRSQASE